jgi:hypothetical protein
MLILELDVNPRARCCFKTWLILELDVNPRARCCFKTWLILELDVNPRADKYKLEKEKIYTKTKFKNKYKNNNL